MKRYKMEVVSQTLYIIAENEEQAEEKYGAFFNWEDPCPCGSKECACVTEEEDVYHITTEDDSKESCGVCGELTETEGGEFSFAHPLYVVFTCRDCSESVSCGACGLLVPDLEEHFIDCDENPANNNDDNANPDNHFVNPNKENN